MKLGISVDIGGTKTVVGYGDIDRGNLIKVCPIHATQDYSVEQMLLQIQKDIGRIIARNPDVSAIGISCGGPLDSERGIILAPPNLPSWNQVPIVDQLESKFGIPAYLENDANLCALAEWKYGAGQGFQNLVFLTFGTGFGAGLILNGRIYSGINHMAGEIGHIRLTDYGPVGYGKMGSYEGFCSGSGLSQLGESLCRQAEQSDRKTDLVKLYQKKKRITAQEIGQAAKMGDPVAKQILSISSQSLGRAVAVLIDLLVPEIIVIGSIYQRLVNEMAPTVEAVVEREILAWNQGVTRIVPAALQDQVGLIAGLSLIDYRNKNISG